MLQFNRLDLLPSPIVASAMGRTDEQPTTLSEPAKLHGIVSAAGATLATITGQTTIGDVFQALLSDLVFVCHLAASRDSYSVRIPAEGSSDD